VFAIGHGIGTIAGHYPDKRFTVAEIDQRVVECSRLYFGYRQNNVVVGDGRRILGTEEPNAFDYIIVDAFNRKGTPFHLTTAEFFKMTVEKLSPRGAIIMNVMGKPKNDKLVDAIHTTLGEAYAYTKAFSLPETSDADIRNMIVVGSNRTIDFRPREMAGFYEIELGQGHLILDSGSY
jgi:spermidine synthase